MENTTKVYVIWGWNGESWEDSYEWIEDIYKSKENAKDRLKELNDKAKRNYDTGASFELFVYKIKEVNLKD